MYINIISAYRDIVALADKELVGRQFEEDKKFLDVKESFYKGTVKTEDDIVQLLKFHQKEDATFNIVGERSIALALREGIIPEELVGHVDGIPFAMVLL
jgi:hypothetical protein